MAKKHDLARNKLGVLRSETEDNLRREGLKQLSDAQLDRVKWMEKKNKRWYSENEIGLDKKNPEGSERR